MIDSTNISCVVHRTPVQENVWNRPYFTYKKSEEWTEIQELQELIEELHLMCLLNILGSSTWICMAHRWIGFGG